MSQNGSPILDDFLECSSSTFEQLPQTLGPNWETVLDFWKFRSSLTAEQSERLRERYCMISYNDRQVSKRVAQSIIGPVRRTDVWQVTYPPEEAAYEIIAMHKLIEDDYTFKFLPMFENL